MRVATCILSIVTVLALTACQSTAPNSGSPQTYTTVSHEGPSKPKPGVDRNPPIHVRFNGVTYVRRDRGGLEFHIIPRMPDGKFYIPRDLEGDIELRDILATYFTRAKVQAAAATTPASEDGCLEHMQFGSAKAACTKSGCSASCGAGMAVWRAGKAVQYESCDTTVDLIATMDDPDIGSVALGCTCK